MKGRGMNTQIQIQQTEVVVVVVVAEDRSLSTPVSYTHLDVYKRQELLGNLIIIHFYYTSLINTN